MNKTLLRLTGASFFSAGLLFTAVAFAQIESLNLSQMLERADSAIVGSVIEKKTWEADIDGLQVEFTTITVEGEDLYSGKNIKKEISYLGSEARPVSEMPVENESRTGTRALFFSVARPKFGGRENQNSLMAAQNGIFRIEAGPKGDVVVGKGAGAAVEANVFLKDLRGNVANELARIKKEGRK
ncbi:MAG: hypothetical protein ACKVS6_15690 [Planctomycetota bacterium]